MLNYMMGCVYNRQSYEQISTFIENFRQDS